MNPNDNPNAQTVQSSPKTTFVVPFSHLDLFWAGSREECLSRGNFIIRRALDLLDIHPDFRFLLETMNFVEHYLRCFPQEKKRVARLAAEGRLELGPLWSAIYQNLPGGETLVRNALYAKRYARETLNADPAVAHFGDLPGYTPQYPQIAALAEIDAVLISRGGPSSSPLFWWRSPDGSKVAAYFSVRGYGRYSSPDNCVWHEDYATLAGGELETLIEEDAVGKDYPLLIHWGCDLFAPNERVIENTREWNRNHPRQLRFTTLTEYFAAVRESASRTLSGELPSAWPNIESSWPDIWPEDFPCEAALHLAEFLSTLCLLQDDSAYPTALLEDAWKALLDGMDHNQNSQGGDTADRDKLQLKRWSRYTAERIRDRMAWQLAAHIGNPRADAFPVVVFNSLSWKRTGIVTARAAAYGTVKPWEHPGRHPDMQLIDAAGKTIPYVQLQRYQGISSTFEIAFLADALPSAGYQTYYLVPGKNPVTQSVTCAITLDADIDRQNPQRNQGTNVFENRFFRLELDAVTGEATLTDRRHERTIFRKAAIVGVEERRGDYIMNMTPSGRTFPASAEAAEIIDNNAVWCRVRVRGSVYGMTFAQTYTLFNDVPDLLLENEIDWQEPRWVRLQQLFPYETPEAVVRYAVPFGQVTYPETMGELTRNCADEIDPQFRAQLRLCRQWIDIGTETAGITIGCDHRMWEFEDGLLRSYMIRGAGFCLAKTVTPEGEPGNIARPPAGTYRFRYLLRLRDDSLAQAASYRCGWELNHPAHTVAVCDHNHDGTQPQSFSLLDFSDSSVIMIAIKRAESGEGIVVRAFECAGQPTSIGNPIIAGTSAVTTNLLERPDQIPPEADIRLRPFEIRTLLFPLPPAPKT